jgi:hypothetical protein
MTDTATADAPATLAGFVGRGRYRRVECDWFEPVEGAERLFAEIRADIPFGVLDDIPLGGDESYNDLWDAIGPMVRAWNALGLDIRTGEYRPVPPPAEIGREAFAAVDPLIGIWLGQMLKQTYRQAVSDPKATASSAASGGGPSSASAPASSSSGPEKPSRTNQKARRSTLAST